MVALALTAAKSLVKIPRALPSISSTVREILMGDLCSPARASGSALPLSVHGSI